jgi:hypothetical protein
VPRGAAHRWFEPLLTVDDDRFLVHGHESWTILRYVAGGGTTRPHLATLCGPAGRNMLETSPVDHLHHHGVWWGHGDVNGVDYYLELPGGEGPDRLGHIEHERWAEVVDDAPRFGFTQDLGWRDDTGAVVIRERRRLLLDLSADDHYVVDLDSDYVAQTDLVFGDTKEAVMPSIRLAEALTGAVGGTITSSRGNVGEKATFGQRAEWVDVSGPRTLVSSGEVKVEGLACLDHPANPDHPSRWFTRAYGPISPFEGHHFYEDRTLAEGASLRLRHRLVVHQGDVHEAAIADRYREYAAAPTADGRTRDVRDVEP